MARVNIELPNAYAYETVIAVRVDDVNFAGHLGHDSLITLLHEARARLFRSLGGHELDIFGAGIILADIAVAYSAEAFAGEQLLVQIAVAEFGTRSCELVYRVTKHAGEGQAPVEVARAKTGMVFFDYQARLPIGIPAAFREALSGPALRD